MPWTIRAIQWGRKMANRPGDTAPNPNYAVQVHDHRVVDAVRDPRTDPYRVGQQCDGEFTREQVRKAEKTGAVESSIEDTIKSALSIGAHAGEALERADLIV